MRQNRWCLPAVVCMVLAVAPWGYAGSVTVNITGQVTASDHIGIPVGSLVTGSYTYDDAATLTFVSAGPVATYFIDGLGLAFADGSTVASATARFQFTDDAAPGPNAADLYDVFNGAISSATGSFAGGHISMSIGWSDPTCTAWNGSFTIPDPADLMTMFREHSGSVMMDFPGESYWRDVDFTVTGLSVAPPAVPAPGAMLLGTLGAGFVGWLRRRRTL